MTLAIFTYAIFTGLCAFVTELGTLQGCGSSHRWGWVANGHGCGARERALGGRNRAWIAGLIGVAANLVFFLPGY